MLSTVWKVVRVIENDDGEEFYTSAYVDVAGLRLEYRIDEWTYPVIGSLFAFGAEDDAQAWATQMDSARDCRFEVYRSSTPLVTPTHNCLSGISWEEAVKFWKNPNERWGLAPFNTVLCPALMLEEWEPS